MLLKNLSDKFSTLNRYVTLKKIILQKQDTVLLLCFFFFAFVFWGEGSGLKGMINIHLKAIRRKETKDQISLEMLEAEVTDSTRDEVLKQGLTLGVRVNLGGKESMNEHVFKHVSCSHL